MNTLDADGNRVAPQVLVAADGTWTTTGTFSDSAAVVQNLSVNQIGGAQGQGEVNFTINLPAVTTPGRDAADAHHPKDGSTVDSRTVTFSGKGTPGDAIAVVNAEGDVVAPATIVEADGTWTTTGTFSDSAARTQDLTVGEVDSNLDVVDTIDFTITLPAVSTGTGTTTPGAGTGTPPRVRPPARAPVRPVASRSWPASRHTRSADGGTTIGRAPVPVPPEEPPHDPHPHRPGDEHHARCRAAPDARAHRLHGAGHHDEHEALDIVVRHGHGRPVRRPERRPGRDPAEARYNAVIGGLLPYYGSTVPKVADESYTISADAPLYGDDRSKPVARLAAKNFLDQPTVVVPVQVSGDWAMVLTPARQALPSATKGGAAAQSAAWIRRDLLRKSGALSDHVVIAVGKQTVSIVGADGKTVHEFPAGVGAGGTPTPTGVIGYIQARYLDPAQDQTVHPIQLTTLHSAAADEPYGGKDGGLIGVHYQSVARGAVSHGCVRLDGDAVDAVNALPLGTVVQIVA